MMIYKLLNNRKYDQTIDHGRGAIGFSGVTIQGKIVVIEKPTVPFEKSHQLVRFCRFLWHWRAERPIRGTFGNFDAKSARTQSSSAVFSRHQPRQPNAYVCTRIAPFPWAVGSTAIQRIVKVSYDRLGKIIGMLRFHWPSTYTAETG